MKLKPFLHGVCEFAEPCAGEGDLVRHLRSIGLRCVYAGDIATGQDALLAGPWSAPVVTNPPWIATAMHPLLAHFIASAPFVWSLHYNDWASTARARNLLRHCTDIVPVGRVKWFADSEGPGFDNASWHRFERDHSSGPVFHLPGSTPHGASTRACLNCQRPFRPKRRDARYCGNTCRQAAHRAIIRDRAVTKSSYEPEGRRGQG